MRNTPTVCDEMSNVLSRMLDLGSTPDTVAQTLFESGIRGYPGSSVACPVARWLNQVSHSDSWTVSSNESHSLGDVVTIVVNPAPVSQFVELFDDGKYTDLYPDDYDYATFLAGV